MTSSSPWLDHKLRVFGRERAPVTRAPVTMSIFNGLPGLLLIHILSCPWTRNSSVPPSLSCPVEKRVKPFINKGGGVERPSGSILSLHRRNSIKVPRCYFSSHHLSEIPTRVSCEPHVKSSPEPKRKNRRNMKLELQKWQHAHSLSSEGYSLMSPPCSEPHFLFLFEKPCGFSCPSLALQYLLRHQNRTESPGGGGLMLQVASYRASTVSIYNWSTPVLFCFGSLRGKPRKSSYFLLVQVHNLLGSSVQEWAILSRLNFCL